MSIRKPENLLAPKEYGPNQLHDLLPTPEIGERLYKASRRKGIPHHAIGAANEKCVRKETQKAGGYFRDRQADRHSWRLQKEEGARVQ